MQKGAEIVGFAKGEVCHSRPAPARYGQRLMHPQTRGASPTALDKVNPDQAAQACHMQEGVGYPVAQDAHVMPPKASNLADKCAVRHVLGISVMQGRCQWN